MSVSILKGRQEDAKQHPWQIYFWREGEIENTGLFSHLFFSGEVLFARKILYIFFITKGASHLLPVSISHFKVWIGHSTPSPAPGPPMRRGRSQWGNGRQPPDYVLPESSLKVGSHHGCLWAQAPTIGPWSVLPHLLPPCCKCLLEIGLALQLSLVQLVYLWLGG